MYHLSWVVLACDGLLSRFCVYTIILSGSYAPRLFCSYLFCFVPVIERERNYFKISVGFNCKLTSQHNLIQSGRILIQLNSVAHFYYTSFLDSNINKFSKKYRTAKLGGRNGSQNTAFVPTRAGKWIWVFWPLSIAYLMKRASAKFYFPFKSILVYECECERGAKSSCDKEHVKQTLIGNNQI